jgi:OTT_1508-like deaminase
VQKGAALMRHVHAEVQMVVFYETYSVPAERWPRVMGAFKEACFLCHEFVAAHGRFAFLTAHRQIFHQWTIPDLKVYKPEALVRLRRSLAVVDQAVVRSLKECQASKPRGGRAPLRSSINLLKVILPNPSLTPIGLTSNIEDQETDHALPSPPGSEAQLASISSGEASSFHRHHRNQLKRCLPSHCRRTPLSYIKFPLWPKL